MVERKKNPFLPPLPKKPGIRWRAGTAKGSIGLPAIPESFFVPAEPATPAVPYQRGPGGRKPKDRTKPPKVREPVHADGPQPDKKRLYPNAGVLQRYEHRFGFISNAAWGTATDLVPLAHGPSGCGYFTQGVRDALPGRLQGIESFAELHFTTALGWGDLRMQGGDVKLAQVLDEIDALFPLAKGTVILNEDPIGLAESDPSGVACAKNNCSQKLTISLPTENYRPESVDWNRLVVSVLRAAAQRVPEDVSQHNDVAITLMRQRTGLCWIVASLLSAIGLNPIFLFTGTSAAEMGRVTRCRLSLGFAPMLDVPYQHLATGYARLLEKSFGIPIQWVSFVGPTSTSTSLRRIASHFDSNVQTRAEAIITQGEALKSAIIGKYRPRLEGKLMLYFYEMTEEQLEPFQLLGLRIGNTEGWEGKYGRYRVPHVVCDRINPTEKSIDTLIAEAKPNLILHGERDEWEWKKRGVQLLPANLLCRSFSDEIYWGYDGFASLAAQLDRVINAPWHKLFKPPWQEEGG